MIEIQKNKNEVIRIERSTFKDIPLVNLRVWFKNADGEFAPSKKGIAFNESLLPDIIEALQKV